MNRNIILASLFLLSLTVLLSGCGSGDAQCKKDSDCLSRTCFTVSCEDRQCDYDPLPNCCGNGIKDAIEDGKPGSGCTCPQDYGACEQKVMVEVRGRETEAEYLGYYCNAAEECVLGVDENLVRPVTLVDERDFKVFKLEATVTNNQPFNAAKDVFTFRITLKDDSDDLVLPIKFTKVLLTGGEVLFGEKNIDSVLTGVGDTVTFQVPMTYQPQEPEESHTLSYQIDYEYTQKLVDERLPDGSVTYQEEVQRNDYTTRFRTTLTVVDTTS